MSEQPNLIPFDDARDGSATPTGSKRARPPKPPVPTFAKGERVTVCVEDGDEAAEILTVVKMITRAYVVGLSDADTDPIHYSRTTLRQKHTLRDIRIRKYRDGDEKAVALLELRQRCKEADAALGNAEAAIDAARSNLQRSRDDVVRWQDVIAARETEANGKAAVLHALDAEIATMMEAP